ncbi:DNA cytosine methyltransferase [Solibaculum intestinale]|uniref:DNA (cytosine-5-)-methyltransferase n=1 Tax=Solibaculum intestinale TaxID=3133165 RepID=A0ABV1DZW7_9FIRM
MDVEVFSFFSGLGFLDLGFENAGFNIVFVNEHDKRFLSAYQYARRNSGHTPVYGYSENDVRDYLSDTLWNKTFPNYNNRENKLIGFIGGPPCPDFSTAGKNEGEKGENGQLTSVYVKLITKYKPDFFVLENVKGLFQTKKHKEFYERMKRKLYRAGYSLFDSLENALEYGVPQYRDRLVLIGLLRSRFGQHLDFQIGHHRQYTMEEIQKINWPQIAPFEESGDLCKPDGLIDDLTVENWFTRNDVRHHPNANDIFAVKSISKFTSIPEGDSGGKSFKRLHRWRYSPTAAYGNNEVHLHPYLPRRISVAEALAIQSLPADFSLPPDLPLSAKFKMVGNGVPYLLAFGIAKDLSEWIEQFLHRIEE